MAVAMEYVHRNDFARAPVLSELAHNGCLWCRNKH